MTDLIVIAAVAIITALAAIYIIRAKKRGIKCIGCPESANCSAKTCCGNCASCSMNSSCGNKK